MVADMVTLNHLSEVAAAVEGRLIGADQPFQGVSTDSRTVAAGELFVALKGPNFNGEAYVEAALQRGAVAAMVSTALDHPIAQIVVTDTLQGLGALAAAWRRQFSIPLLAITGSNGKTTVKEMVASVLSCQGPGISTAGNLNNEIGVPLTLLRIKPKHRWAVVEMGASAPGEIARLVTLAAPTAALVNNAGSAHLGGFGSVQQVVDAKGEIYAGLPSGGVAVINRALPQQSQWSRMASSHPQLHFGYAPSPDCPLWGEVALERPFVLEYQGGRVVVVLPLPGEHNRINALAAAALALQAGATLEQIQQGLERVESIPGRLHRVPGRRGCSVIDDGYNASPESMQSAIAVLAATPGQQLLVVGDMGELGESAAQLHRDVGEWAAAAGIDSLYAVGQYAAEVAAGYGAGAKAFTALEPLLDALEPRLQQGTTILVKGSRFMKMERIVNALTETDEVERIQTEVSNS